MKIPHLLTHGAACSLLAMAASLALAQTAPTKPAIKAVNKTLSGKTAGAGKLMTRDELRTCMRRSDDLNASAKAIESQRPVLDGERDALKQSGEILVAERAEVDRRLAGVREWEGKMRLHGAEIEAFNKRSAGINELPRKQQEQLAEELKVDRERLEKTRLALGVEEAQLVPAYQASAKTYNERAVARDAKVTAWNARNAAALDASVKQQEDRALWLNECANRPYLEDDETAIKAGK
ncbi:MAG: hypothetical protein V4792_18325 [Pseudomonadota bacterium]